MKYGCKYSQINMQTVILVKKKLILSKINTRNVRWGNLMPQKNQNMNLLPIIKRTLLAAVILAFQSGV